MKEFTDILRTRCGGLLEVVKNGGDMEYIHRTARDYIQKPKTWEMLLTYTSGLEFDPWFIWSVVYLQWLKAYADDNVFSWTNEWSLSDFWEFFAENARNIASTEAKGHTLALVEEFDGVAQWQLKSITPPDDLDQLEHWYNCDNYYTQRSHTWHTMDILSACIKQQVYPYVEMRIISDPSLMQLKYDPSLVALAILEKPQYPERDSDY